MPKPVLVRAGQVEFLKVNTGRWDWRDAYQWLLALSWPRFSAFIASVYIAINLIFAALYSLGGDSIAYLTPGSFVDAFFFSVQTLATVGYGHMYPHTLYGHVVTTLEIISGMFGLAVITGLIFVRFSRPTARILFSKSIVIAPFNGRPALMLRIANLRQRSLVEAEFRVMFSRDQDIVEEKSYRHFYQLKLDFDRLTVFPAALTLRHTIDERSPLHGATLESLEASNATFVASVVGVETVIPAAVQTQQNYTWRDVRFGERFVEIYSDLEEGRMTVDYGRIHDTEPVAGAKAAP
jgi:inward rectifier potassium channel